MTPTDNFTIKLIDSLYNKKILSLENDKIYKEYLDANKSLIEFSKKGFKALNSIEFDSINKYRKNIQHHSVTKIKDSETIFKKRLSKNQMCKEFLFEKDISFGVVSGI